MPEAILLLGSNIQPRENLSRALKILRNLCKVSRTSDIYQTRAVGSPGPDFLNQAVIIHTDLNIAGIKDKIITPIELTLQRVRVEDKYAPRTIDVDLIMLNGEVLDQNLWNQYFAAKPVSDLAPNLLHPDTRKPLRQIAMQLGEEKEES